MSLEWAVSLACPVIFSGVPKLVWKASEKGMVSFLKPRTVKFRKRYTFGFLERAPPRCDSIQNFKGKKALACNVIYNYLSNINFFITMKRLLEFHINISGKGFFKISRMSLGTPLNESGHVGAFPRPKSFLFTCLLDNFSAFISVLKVSSFNVKGLCRTRIPLGAKTDIQLFVWVEP